MTRLGPKEAVCLAMFRTLIAGQCQSQRRHRRYLLAIHIPGKVVLSECCRSEVAGSLLLSLSCSSPPREEIYGENSIVVRPSSG